MKSGDPPTLEELEETRRKLIEQIKEAEKMVGAAESVEVRTIKSGLKLIEEQIEALRASADG